MSNLMESIKLIKSFLKTMKEYPEAVWQDCLSTGQIDSKIWLIQELENLNLSLGTIFILAGWYGTLVRFMFESKLNIKSIRSFDIDESCQEIAETLNREFVLNNWQFKATTLDILDINYPLQYNTLRRDKTQVTLKEYPNTIINTSCEHLNLKWYNKIPEKTLVILQSNNFEIIEHINCVNSVRDMYNKYPMTSLLFMGKLKLEKYTRYMLIGYK